MIVRSLDVLTDQRTIFLLHHGVVFAHVFHILNYQASLCLHNRDLQILNAFRNICCEMRLQLVALLDFF